MPALVPIGEMLIVFVTDGWGPFTSLRRLISSLGAKARFGVVGGERESYRFHIL